MGGERMRGDDETYATIRAAVDATPLVDTHEHLVQERERLATTPDVFAILLTHYASSDLLASGMPEDALASVRDPQQPLTDRWRLLEPHWARIQNTGYARALTVAVKALYGVDGITRDSLRDLAARMERANTPGLYHRVLREQAGIERVILDTSTETPVEAVDPTLFSPVIRFRDFITARSHADLDALARRWGRPIHSLRDLVEALETAVQRVAATICGVKVGLAYMRTLRFEKTTFHDAEAVFNDIHRQTSYDRVVAEGRARYVPSSLSLREAKPLQDFLMHRVIQCAGAQSLPVQIHTGLQEGNDNLIGNANPTHLVNLFREYREVRFDVFHGAYPYLGELATLAKNFPNVYIDMCWLHVISPFRARQALSEWLDTVPANKIFGFGGDYRFVEGVVGHALIARANVARVLTEKVAEGAYTVPQAVTVARQLLRENAATVFFPARRGGGPGG
jgi:hypothetical protein